MGQEELETPEAMSDFFDLRADGYDDYLKNEVFSHDVHHSYYQSLSSPIAETDEAIKVADLGCGTGTELKLLFEKAPNARVTGVDVSKKMLDLLQGKYVAQADQISIVIDSFLTLDLGHDAFDYIMSGLAFHHFLHDTKRSLYSKIRAALKPGGKYIEGDSVTPKENEHEFIDEYNHLAAMVPPESDGYYHIDIPFSLDTQKEILYSAGFRNFDLIWQKDPAELWNIAVYSVTK